jgi:hypothetical protein
VLNNISIPLENKRVRELWTIEMDAFCAAVKSHTLDVHHHIPRCHERLGYRS